MAKVHVAVVDGQGGGMGKALIEKFRQALGDGIHITALGTNSLATSLMLRAGADDGATGENAIVVTVERADFVAGAIGILAANAMLGEISPAIACAVGNSSAQKILVPINRCQISVAGVRDTGFGTLIDDAAGLLKASLADH